MYTCEHKHVRIMYRQFESHEHAHARMHARTHAHTHTHTHTEAHYTKLTNTHPHTHCLLGFVFHGVFRHWFGLVDNLHTSQPQHNSHVHKYCNEYTYNSAHGATIDTNVHRSTS